MSQTKLIDVQIADIKTKKAAGQTVKSLAIEYNVSMSCINYHTLEKAKTGAKRRATAWNKIPGNYAKHAEWARNNKDKSYPCMTKSMLKHCLNKGWVTLAEIRQFLDELESKGELK